MNLLRLSMILVLLAPAALLGKKGMPSINDYILFWTPKMIVFLGDLKNLVHDNTLKQEAEQLIAQWNSFNTHLSPRKSNQKIFLQLSKKTEDFFEQVSSSQLENAQHKIVETIKEQLHTAVNNVRGKK